MVEGSAELWRVLSVPGYNCHYVAFLHVGCCYHGTGSLHMSSVTTEVGSDQSLLAIPPVSSWDNIGTSLLLSGR